MITKINNLIYRGPLPSNFEIYLLLGFKTVINLETDIIESIKDTEDDELIACYNGKISYYDFCLSNWFPPKQSQVKIILDIIQNGNHPVYIHCRHGHERTGFIIAVYRMQLCGWSFEAAFKEWKDMGCHWPWHWLWKNELRKYEVVEAK